MGLSTKVPCEARGFSHNLNPHRFLQSEILRLCFPMLEPWVEWSVLLPSCSSRFIRSVNVGPPAQPAAALLHILSAQLPVSAPPTGLDECCFFNSGLWDFHTVRFSGSSGYFLFLICCCPSFACARRHSVSTDTSILARSLIF